jgi:hypothetical protein
MTESKNDNPQKWESQSDKEATYALPSFRAIIPWKTIQYLNLSHLRKAACKMISITTKDTHACTPPFDIQYSLFPSQFPVEEK